MKNNLLGLLVTMIVSVPLMSGCTLGQMEDAELAFTEQLEKQGYSVHRKFVSTNDGVTQATVDPVRGCVVGFKQNENDTSYYWLYAFFRDGEHAWPEGPRNLSRTQLVEVMDTMMADPKSSKPESIDQCYNKDSS